MDGRRHGRGKRSCALVGFRRGIDGNRDRGVPRVTKIGLSLKGVWAVNATLEVFVKWKVTTRK